MLPVAFAQTEAWRMVLNHTICRLGTCGHHERCGICLSLAIGHSASIRETPLWKHCEINVKWRKSIFKNFQANGRKNGFGWGKFRPQQVFLQKHLTFRQNTTILYRHVCICAQNSSVKLCRRSHGFVDDCEKPFAEGA